jgi:hypothetical protein
MVLFWMNSEELTDGRHCSGLPTPVSHGTTEITPKAEVKQRQVRGRVDRHSRNPYQSSHYEVLLPEDF